MAGRLFYVIGASGAGKDTFLGEIRTHSPHILVAHRYITRPAGGGGDENHIALSPEQFERRKNANLFTMAWHAHDTHYGIGVEILEWLNTGYDVMVNGSRSYLPTAEKVISDTPYEFTPVAITVESTVLYDRIKNRGRETEQQIQHRLQRHAELANNLPPNCIKIANNTTVDDMVAQFNTLYNV